MIEDNLGAGVRLGGHTVDGVTYGVKNVVYGNTIKDNGFAGINAVVSTDFAMASLKPCILPRLEVASVTRYSSPRVEACFICLMRRTS